MQSNNLLNLSKTIRYNLVLFFLLIFSTLVGSSQTTIFSESLGTVTGTTTIATYTGWQNNATLTFGAGAQTNPCDLRATNVSSTYAGASGSANAFFTSTSGNYGLSVENINASAYQNLTLQFGYRKESGTAHATFAVDYWNGSAWVTVANTASSLFNEANNASTGWYLSKVLSLPSGANINGLKVRFVKTAGLSIRVDDIVLKGTFASPPVVISNSSTGTVGTPFTYTISATNSPTSYTSSSLPANGLSLAAVTGIISGTPTTSGSFSIALDATNAAGIGSGTLSLTVNPGNQTITGLTSSEIKMYGDASYNLTATTNSGLPITYISSDPLVASISGNTVTIVGVGTTTITASQAGDANWNAATDATQTLTVNQASQTIAFGALPAKLSTDAPFALTGTASSGLPVSYSSSNTSVATISGNIVTILTAGTTIITASQAGNANYLPATDVDQTQLINPAGLLTQTITFNAMANATYGDAPITLTATASSGLPVSYSSSSAAISISGNLVTILAPGTATIIASQAGNGSYYPATDVNQTLTIDIKNLTVTGAVASNKQYDGTTTATIDLTSATLVGVVGSDNVTLSGGGDFATSNVGAGINVTPSLVLGGTEASYYSLTQPTLSADITLANQVITFGSLPSKFYGNAPFTISATGGASGNAVTFVSDNPSVADVVGNLVTIYGAGTANITASQLGNSNYAIAADVVQLLTVGQGFNNITFAALTGKVVGDAPFALTATATSGGVVTYTSSNPAVADVVGNIVTIYSVGTTVITASEPGNANYLPATNVTRTLTVTYPIIAAWDFFGQSSPSTFVATTFNTNLSTASNENLITRGSGAVSSVGGNSFRTTGFQNNGIALTNTDYFQTTLKATSGNSISLSSISANCAGTASFANAPGVSSQFAYSLDGSNFVLIGSPVVTVGSPASLPLIDVTSINDLQNVPSSTTITIRYYASGQTTTGGWGFNSPAAGVNGLAFGGDVHVTPPYNSVVNLTCFLECYVDQTLSPVVAMRPSCFNNSVCTNANDVDNITVSLHDAPPSLTQVASVTTVLSTDGTATATFPPLSGNYYIKVQSTNHITTWSNGPVAISGTPNSYNFSTATTQAAGGNMIVIPGSSLFAFFGGDFDHNGGVDNDDYTLWEADANDFVLNMNTDADGNGGVDNDDYPCWEINAGNFISEVTP